MKSIGDCVSVAEALSPEDRDAVLERVDVLRADGIDPEEAGRTAARDLLAEIDAEIAEFNRLAREQHPAAFAEAAPAEPEGPPRSRFFTNPDEYQSDAVSFSRAQTETPEFKAWFGDSKVVDADGKPLVVYHATAYGDFNEFTKAEQRKGMAGFGFYFSDVEGSNVYAEHSQRFKLDRSWKGEPKQINTMPVYLRMDNPLRADNIADVARRFNDPGAFGVGRSIAGLSDDAKTAIQRAGYDGVITNEYVRKMRNGSLAVVEPDAKGAIKHPVYVVFEPQQIKSAIGNRGTFDPNNRDIRFSRAQPTGRVSPASVVEQSVADGAARIAEYIRRGGVREFVQVGLGGTPHVLRMLGYSRNGLVVDNSILDKVFLGKHKDETRKLTPQGLMEALHQPAAVWRHGQDLVLMLPLQGTEGAPIVAPLRVEGPNAQVKSIYELNPPEQAVSNLTSVFKKGDVLYADIAGAEMALQSKSPLSGAVAAGGLRSSAGGTASRQATAGVTPSGSNPSSSTLDIEVSRQNPQQAAPLTRAPDRLGNDSRARILKQLRQAVNVGTVSGRGDLTAWIASNYIGPGEGMPMFSRGQGRFILPRFNKIDQSIASLQDRYNRWKQAVDAVREQGGTVTEVSDFYRAEERYWGRVGAQVEDFQQEIEDWLKDMAEDKLTLADVATYVYAKHAPERNAYIASIRPDMPDGGSGMSTDDDNLYPGRPSARTFMADAQQSGLQPLLDKHADKLQEWIQGTRDVLFEGGLLSEEEWLDWTAMFQHYVPLRGLDGAPEWRGTGAGFSIGGKEGKRALGRFSEATGVIENILQDRARAYIRVGKNDVLKSFAKFVLDNPDPKLWQVDAVQNKPTLTVDANGNRVVEVKPTIVTGENTVVLKDAGKEIHILIHDRVLREQMKNLNEKDLPTFFGGLLWANRQMARMYTSLNPVFTILNAARDVQAATVGMVDSVGFLGAARLWKKLPEAVAEAYKAEFGTPSADYELFRATGGKTGFFVFGDVDERAAELSSMLADAERTAINPIKLGRSVLRFTESANAVIENATRFATWQAARESGKSVAESSAISKNITVNFNRKGTATNAVSAFFLFFNPAVQGTARMLQALRSPKVLSVLGAGMTAVVGIVLMNAGMGEDDDGVSWWDKIPDEVKERNMVFVLPPGSAQGEEIPGSKTGRYIKVPMPYGYNFFAVLAMQFADLWRNNQDPTKGRSMTAGAARALNAFLGSWLPTPELGRAFTTADDATAGKSLALFAAPDAFSPLLQVALNQNAFGRKLSPDDQTSKDLPDSARYFAGQEGTVYQRAAEGLNRMTGGGDFRSGLFDVSPASIENIVRGYGGGPASFILDLANVFYVRQNIERPAPEWRRAPFVKQLYGVIDAETDRMVAYDRMQDVEAVITPLKKAKRAGKWDEARAIRAEDPAMAELGDELLAVRKQLTALRKRELAIMTNDTLSDPEKYVRMQAMNEQRRSALQRFNKRFDSAVRKQEGKERMEEAPALVQ